MRGRERVAADDIDGDQGGESAVPGDADLAGEALSDKSLARIRKTDLSKLPVVKTGTLSFTATAVMKTVTVSVKSEFVAEPDETFTLALGNEVGSATLTKPIGTATIINDV